MPSRPKEDKQDQIKYLDLYFLAIGAFNNYSHHYFKTL